MYLFMKQSLIRDNLNLKENLSPIILLKKLVMEFTPSKRWFLFGLAVYVLLFIFQYLILICLPEIFDINKFGSLGDFIAGFTAPIINMIAAILVYKSFQAQVKANEMQFKA